MKMKQKLRYVLMMALVAYCSQTMAILVDNFDPATDGSQWSSISLGTATTGAGFLDGNALWFDGAGERSATTISLNTIGGATVQFDFRAGDDSALWEDADPGENVVLEYSNDGIAFSQLLDMNSDLITSWTNFTIAVPGIAQTASTQFRWRQLSNSGSNFDNWAIDNVEISTVPEPASIALIGLGTMGLLYHRRRGRFNFRMWRGFGMRRKGNDLGGQAAALESGYVSPVPAVISRKERERAKWLNF